MGEVLQKEGFGSELIAEDTVFGAGNSGSFQGRPIRTAAKIWGAPTPVLKVIPGPIGRLSSMPRRPFRPDATLKVLTAYVSGVGVNRTRLSKQTHVQVRVTCSCRARC